MLPDSSDLQSDSITYNLAGEGRINSNTKVIVNSIITGQSKLVHNGIQRLKKAAGDNLPLFDWTMETINLTVIKSSTGYVE